MPKGIPKILGPMNFVNMGFVNRMDQNVAKYRHTNDKMVVVPICLNGRCCSSGCLSIASY